MTTALTDEHMDRLVRQYPGLSRMEISRAAMDSQPGELAQALARMHRERLELILRAAARGGRLD